MTMRLVLLGVAVVLALVTATVVSAGPEYSFALTAPHGAVALLVAGTALMFAGLVRSRRDRRLRPALLLSAAGYAWFAAEWDNPGAFSALVFSLGLALYAVCPAVIAHLVLSFPTGNLGSWVSRTLVTAGYAITLGVQGVAAAALYQPETLGCRRCPANLWLIADDPSGLASIERLGVRAGTLWALTTVAVIAWRLLTSSPARRRAIGTVELCAVVYLGTVAAYYMVSLDRGLLGSDRRDVWLWLAQAPALCLLAIATLADLVRAHGAHRELTRLVIDLGTSKAPGDLRAAIAQRLGDPDLVMGFPIDSGRRHVDADANTVDVRASDGRTSTTLRYGGPDIATLVHRTGVLDPGMKDDLVSALRLSLENARLHAEGLAQLADLRASGARIVSAGDEERRHLERDLHDGAQQRLIGLAMGLRLIRMRAPIDAPQRQNLEAAEDELQEAINDLRRVAQGIHPVLLRDAGLATALDALGQSRRLLVERAPPERLPDILESTVYLLVARVTDGRTATVAVDAGPETVVASIVVNGEIPDIADLEDRITTLAGHLTTLNDDDSTRLILTLPRGQEYDQSVRDRTVR